jgi:phosphatidylglycerophosphate synthase
MNVIPRAARHVWSGAVAGVGGLVARAGVPPVAVAAVGAFATLVGAAAFATGRVRWGGGLVLVGRLCDAVAGHPARQAAPSAVAALYDSTLDRLGETAVFAGLTAHFLRGGVPPERELVAVLLAVAALGTSLLAAYARSRAEGLGLEARVGIGRAERLFVLGVVPLALGPGTEGAVLFWTVAALAAAGTVTLVWRMARAAPAPSLPGARRRDTLAGRGPASKKRS